MNKFLQLLQPDSPEPAEPVGDRTSPDPWSRRRSPLRDSDRSLTSAAHIWLRTVPSGLHPKRLARLHPRIANLIAATWSDAEKTEALFDDLLTDHRGGRRGFPPVVMAELRQLQSLHRNRRRPGMYVIRRR
jgi:hypothetical protein